MPAEGGPAERGPAGSGPADAGFFHHDGFDLAFLDPVGPPVGMNKAEPVLLIHGFASSALVNWVTPGWVTALGDAGFRPVAFDNRGHGGSTRSTDPGDYAPERMAQDAAALLAHLGIARAHVMGYSMGARIAAFLALARADLPATLVFGGLGLGMVDGVGDWDPIARALLADDASAIEPGRPRMFRTFADQTKSDRRALAACIRAARTLIPAEQVASIRQPTLIGVGTRDDLAGSPERLAGLMPDAQAFAIENRDHMLAVGDRSWKERVIRFLREHPISGT